MTADAWQKHPLFINTVMANIVVEQIVSCGDRGFYTLHAFVVMPDRLHVLLTLSDTTTIEKAMQMIIGGAAHRMGQSGLTDFRAMPVEQASACLHLNFAALADFKTKQAQACSTGLAHFHDRGMRDAEEYRGSKHYIEQNPVVARLSEASEAYPFSSANGSYVLDPSRFDAARG